VTTPVAPDSTTAPAAPKIAPEVEAALAELASARVNVDEELIRLEASFRAAIDVPAKIRKQPVKAAGLAAGAGFLAIGGPRKVFRGARRVIFGPGRPLPKSMLPKEIDESLGRLGDDGDRVRGLIEREFSAYLRTAGEEHRKKELSRTTAILMVAAIRPFVLAYGKKLANEVFATDGLAYQTKMMAVRERMAARAGKTGSASGTSGPAAGASAAAPTPTPPASRKDASTGW